MLILVSGAFSSLTPSSPSGSRAAHKCTGQEVAAAPLRSEKQNQQASAPFGIPTLFLSQTTILGQCSHKCLTTANQCPAFHSFPLLKHNPMWQRRGLAWVKTDVQLFALCKVNHAVARLVRTARLSCETAYVSFSKLNGRDYSLIFQHLNKQVDAKQ